MIIKVIQLGPYPPPEGGVSRNMLAIGDELKRQGNECEYIAITRGYGSREADVVSRPSGASEIVRQLRRTNADICHFHLGGQLNDRVLGLLLAVIIFAKGKKVVTVHSGGLSETDVKRKRSIRAILSRFDRVIVVNEKLRQMFLDLGIDSSKLTIIEPFALYPPNQEVKLSPEIAGFISGHSPALLAIGGLETVYQPLEQIKAMEEVKESFPNAGLIIVGAGSLENEVRSAALASGVKDSILITGNLPHEETQHLIDRCDILLRTTLFDGDAISIREALYLQKNVIATNNGMRPEGVDLIDSLTSANLAAAIRSIIKRPARSKIEHTADISNISKVIDLYKEIIALRRRPQH